ncbi:MAG: DNA recombination protein RmuC [Dehalococcoidia bacterium]|nr:DNA recombination protein RmuC [Dehalococcoidia bacterium]
MEWAIGIALGLILGGVSWFIRSARAKSDLASAQATHDKDAAFLREKIAELTGQIRQVESTQAILDDAKKQMKEAFQATASNALQNNNETFLTVANENFGKTLETAKSEFRQQHQQFQELVKPLSDSYSKLNPQIETLTNQVQSVTSETAKLSGALTDSRQMGNWGEIQLQRVVEIAGMKNYCDFAKQSTVDGTGGRPDLVISLPDKRAVVVDAKASTAAFMDARQANGDRQAESAALKKHARALKNQVDDLSSKNYGEGVEGALGFVVMFVPGDQFLAAALEANSGLIEYGMRKKVAIATPASLIALLWTVANGWQQHHLTERTQEIQLVGEEMHKRLMSFINHYQDVGKELRQAVDKYNSSIGSFDSRIAPHGRRFAHLVLNDEEAFKQPSVIEAVVRESSYADQNALQSDDEAA